MLYMFADCILDTERHTFYRANQDIRLRPLVFNLLTYLVEHRDRVISKDELGRQVRMAQFVSDASVENSIKNVRRAVGDSGRTQQIIRTHHGHGLGCQNIVTILCCALTAPKAQDVKVRLDDWQSRKQELCEVAHTVGQRYGGTIRQVAERSFNHARPA
ncbi:winged helix-turn-helix domain-containing protein [Candidatus Entotheonella palauensis]|uniref:OmpR/PhoB-type domain-containing protein n=1 Tax=Candidatus Entotheonella gemina TaxID=1429439 RepID=W4M965_9BACT|nr:winged helix-turn-helix domain-containing protein [Candidatus Entotheonella palauensis]ETX06894.1 MAG: hypothetical protein ETSY2_14390 [Candidatus Entotheonella gemina]